MQSQATETNFTTQECADFYSIGEMAKTYNVTLRALRFYEDRGLIRPLRNGASRYYDPATRGRLQLILKGKHLGFTLAEIREMLAARKDDADLTTLTLGEAQVLEQIELLQRKRVGIEDAIAELRATHERIATTRVEARAMKTPARRQHFARAG